MIGRSVRVFVTRAVRIAVMAPSALIVGWAGTAHAALGDTVASVQTDARNMRVGLTLVSHAAYDVFEGTRADGLRLREFVSPAGMVFAVSWTAAVPPDMNLLLGGYYQEYVQKSGAIQRSGLRRSLRIASLSLVVESGGHMRSVEGRAYLPQLLPAGVSVSEIH